MDNDIQPILSDWPYDPEKLCVRRVEGEDGREKIQLRIEMGILQMEVAGRPDGQRPHGHESLLHHYKEIAGSKGKGQEGFILDSETCLMLQMEALQYYHRRISFLELGDYQLAQDDACRNLDMFDFVKEYAENDEDRLALEEYRPFVIGHRVRAAVLQRLEDESFDQALHEIEDGMEEIRDCYRRLDRPDLAEESEEVNFLKEWAEEIQKDRPRSALQDLRDQLREAVAKEDFEQAAELRDQLRSLSKK